MALLNSGNSRIDKNSGAIIFDGSPEFKEILKIREDLKDINLKLEKLLMLVDGDDYGGKVETSRFSKKNDSET